MTSSTSAEQSAVSGNGQEEFKDLGFGAEVARNARQRLLNADGTFNVVRKGLNPFSSLSLYHWLLTISWPKFIGFVSGSYVAVNWLFAFAFLLCGPDALQSTTGSFAGHPFYRAFFFSVDSFATIGYGNIVPIGLAANTLVMIEALLNILGIALVTGVIFARFSRPSPKIIYSRNAIVAPYRNKTALEFRIANARSNQLIDVRVQVILTKIEPVGESTARRFYDLDLERHRVVFFALSWTVVHPIDERSPLRGITYQDLVDTDAEFLILLTGIDETFSQTVQARSSYKPEEIVWDAKFKDIYRRPRDGGSLSVDVGRIHEIERISSTEAS